MGAREIVTASHVMGKTDSGLSVPQHVLEEKRDAARKRIRWSWDSFKKIRRFILNCEKEKPAILPLLTCIECKTLISIVRLDGHTLTEADADTRRVNDKIALRCDCADRVFVPGV